MDAIGAIYDFAAKAGQFQQIWLQLGYPVKFYQYYRSGQEQEAAFARGASKARAGQSAHQYYLAADYMFDKYGWDVPKEYWEYGDQIAKYVGLESGISYGDANHIQYPGWKNWKPYLIALGL